MLSANAVELVLVSLPLLALALVLDTRELDCAAVVELVLTVSTLLVVRVTDDTLSTVDDVDALSRSALVLEFAETLVKLEVSTEDDELALSVALADPLVER